MGHRLITALIFLNVMGFLACVVLIAAAILSAEAALATSTRISPKECYAYAPLLDNTFTDPVADGFLQGKAPPPQGAPCRLRSATPTSPSLVSTRSRTRTSEHSPRTRFGCRARSSCRCARREMPVRR